MPRRLRNEDYSDLELLYILADLADPDTGYILADDVAGKLRITSNGKRTPAGTVSTRLSWMRRYGYLERVDWREHGLGDRSPRWLLTTEGAALIARTELPRSAERVLQSDRSMSTLMMRELVRDAFGRSAGTAYSNAIRREFGNAYANRRR